MAAQTLVRPAAAEVRSMLNRIKMENIERSAKVFGNNNLVKGPRFKYQETSNVTPKHQPEYRPYYEMGSFSMTTSQQCPQAPFNYDDDKVLPPFYRDDLESYLALCLKNAGNSNYTPLERAWRNAPKYFQANGRITGDHLFNLRYEAENIRVLQWNMLSQTLGTTIDKLVRCPPEALNWSTRRFRLVHELARYNPDVICVQEVDHFKFLENWLKPLGYVGFFMPKPDSPCYYLPGNNGPDGCAIFYKENSYDLVRIDKHILNVWSVESNQVLLSAVLRSKWTHQEFVVSTTHLKAKSNAVLISIRHEQSKDLLNHVNRLADGRPVIITGDFNSEPLEPAYAAMTHSVEPKLKSAYAELHAGSEPRYTTWKYREDGEHMETLDYVFYTPDNLLLTKLLEIPSASVLGENRLPSIQFPSDHISLACEFKLYPSHTVGQKEKNI